MRKSNARPLEDDRLRFVLPRASSGARIGAFVIDLVLFGMIGLALRQLGVPGIVERFLWVSYLVGGHLKYGQTLGKRLCGIRVISAEGELTRRQLVLRETIYRTISIFTLGILRAFIARDGEALHDLFAKTRVVSVEARAPEEELAPLLKAAVVFGCLVVSILCAGYALLYTNLPLRQYTRGLELRGARIEGVHGSLMNGIGVDRLIYPYEQGLVSLEDLRFELDFGALFVEGKLKINKLGIGQGRISLTLSELKKAALPVPPGAASSKTKNGKKSLELDIGTIDISDLTVELFDQKKSYHLARFYVSDLEIGVSKVAVGRVFVESDFLDVDIPNLILASGLLRVGPTRIVAKSKILPEGFRRDIDAQAIFEFDIENKSVRSLSVSAFERHLKASVLAPNDGTHAKEVAIELHEFNIGDYYPFEAPVFNVSGKAYYPLDGGQFRVEAASFLWRSFRFESLQNGEFRHARDGRSFSLGLNPPAIKIFLGQMQGQAAPFTLGSDALAAEWLSELYYNRPIAQLLPSEKSLIDLDLKNFAQPVREPALRTPAQVPTQ